MKREKGKMELVQIGINNIQITNTPRHRNSHLRAVAGWQLHVPRTSSRESIGAETARTIGGASGGAMTLYNSRYTRVHPEPVAEESRRRDSARTLMSRTSQKSHQSQRSHVTASTHRSFKRRTSQGSRNSHWGISSSIRSADKADQTGLAELLYPWRRIVKTILMHKAYRITLFLILMFALLLVDSALLSEQDDPININVWISLVITAFLMDVLLQCIAWREYILSIPFWLDIFATASLFFDLSFAYFHKTADGEGVSEVTSHLWRLARRIRLIKLISFLPSAHLSDGSTDEQRMAANLTQKIAVRTMYAFLFVVGIVMPGLNLLIYPAKDYSSLAWAGELQSALTHSPDAFKAMLPRATAFHANKLTNIIRVEGRTQAIATAASLPWLTTSTQPYRKEFLRKYSTEDLDLYFDFTQATQLDAIVDLTLTIFVVFLFFLAYLLLWEAVRKIFLAPVESLLQQIRGMRRKFSESEEATAAPGRASIQSGTKQSDLHIPAIKEGPETTYPLDYEAQMLMAVVKQVSGLRAMKKETNAYSKAAQHAGGCDPIELELDMEVPDAYQDEMRSLAKQKNAIIERAGVSPELANSWFLNPLELDQPRRQALVSYCLSPLNFKGLSLNAARTDTFLRQAEEGYNKAPFTSWFHAVDVTHFAHRVGTMCNTDRYLSSIERFALLVSATCHDIGHGGVNNRHLVQKRDDFALLYNDNSPLENMSCAKLFEITAHDGSDIFAFFTNSYRQIVRGLIIDAIMHTDPKYHYDMVQEYEIFGKDHEKIVSKLHENYKPATFPQGSDVLECFSNGSSRRLFVTSLLRMADISYAVKPFRICRVWAIQATEEFFAQVDHEKELGMPVNVLWDRDHLNRAHVEIGFINFIVAPLMFNVVMVFRPLLHLCENMVDNIKSWHQEWLLDVAKDTANKKGDLQLMAAQEAERKDMMTRVEEINMLYMTICDAVGHE